MSEAQGAPAPSIGLRTPGRAGVASTLVTVRDLPLLADIGINPDEIGRRQPLVISVELGLAAGTIGRISETVDYRRIVATAESIAQIHVPLIETFAQRLAAQCLEWDFVESARVTIDKPFALTRGLAGTQVTMYRSTDTGSN